MIAYAEALEHVRAARAEPLGEERARDVLRLAASAAIGAREDRGGDALEGQRSRFP